jgi:hypothetical protein
LFPTSSSLLICLLIFSSAQQRIPAVENIQQAYIAPLPHRASPQLSPAHALEVGCSTSVRLQADIPNLRLNTEFAAPLRQLVGLPRRSVKFVAVTANLNSRPATFDIASMSARTYRMTHVSYEHRPDQKRNPHRYVPFGIFLSCFETELSSTPQYMCLFFIIGCVSPFDLKTSSLYS